MSFSHPVVKQITYEEIAEYILKASLAIIFTRMFFAFLFAAIYDQEWYIYMMWDKIPTIAFNTDFATFTKINSFSILATTITLFILFLYALFSKNKSYWQLLRVRLWFSGVILTFFQFIIALFLNQYISFSTNPNIGVPITIFMFVAVILYMRFSTRFEQMPKQERVMYLRELDEKKSREEARQEVLEKQRERRRKLSKIKDK